MLKIEIPEIPQTKNLTPSAQEAGASDLHAVTVPDISESGGKHDAVDKKPAASVKSIGKPFSPKKVAASKTNGAKSKGPKTLAGKTISSWNALKHGLLSQRLMQANDEKAMHYSAVLKLLQQDLQPVGALEQILVEKVAYEYFRTANAAQYESAESNLGYVPPDVLGNLVRYQAMINRQLFQAIHQLERQQRLRRGEDIPAPLSLHISHDVSSASNENGS